MSERHGFFGQIEPPTTTGLLGQMPVIGGLFQLGQLYGGQPSFTQQMRDSDARYMAARRSGVPLADALRVEPGDVNLMMGMTSPVRAFHGSPNAFSRFDIARAGSTTDAGQLGRGHYFSTDPRVAQSAAHRYEVDLNLSNPLTLQMPNFRTDKTNLLRRALGLPADAGPESITRAMRAAGHDGVVLDYSPTGYMHREVMTPDSSLIDIVRRYGILGPTAGAAGYGLLGDQ